MNIFFRFKIAEIRRIMDVEFTAGYRKGAKLKLIYTATITNCDDTITKLFDGVENQFVVQFKKNTLRFKKVK